jgi:LuxR family maltose regulon positive regulatory protein
MGGLWYEWNELDRATACLERGIARCLQWGHADALITGYTTLARVQLARGQHAQARETYSHAARIRAQTAVDPWAIGWIDDCRLRLWLAAGDLPAAVAWAAESGLAAQDALSFVRDLEHVNLARVRVAQGLQRPDGPWLDEALPLLERLVEAAQRAGWVGRAIEALVLRAVALAARGDDRRASAALDRALALAEPEGYVRTFLDEGAPVRALLAQAVRRGARYAGALLAAYDAAPAAGARPAISPVDPLTARERQVLRLLATDLQSPEMAQALVVSVNTVRTHIQHVYQKLAVHSRYEAVARARELGLL